MICGGRGPEASKCTVEDSFGRQIFRKMEEGFASEWRTQSARRAETETPLTSGDKLTTKAIGPQETAYAAQPAYRSFLYQGVGRSDHITYTRRFSLDAKEHVAKGHVTKEYFAKEYVFSSSSLGLSVLLDKSGKKLAAIDENGNVDYDVNAREEVEKVVSYAVKTMLGYHDSIGAILDELRCGGSLNFRHAPGHASVKP